MAEFAGRKEAGGKESRKQARSYCALVESCEGASKYAMKLILSYLETQQSFEL